MAVKRIFGVCVFVFGLGISIIASNLPANSQSDRNTGSSGNWSTIANSAEEVLTIQRKETIFQLMYQ